MVKRDTSSSLSIYSVIYLSISVFRKKHGKVMKQDIEASIGYNKYVLESPSLVDSFHSPDTICKYCGIDFKFFRALKHHLRSHSSCRLKPFLCQKCDVGFSTKANCVRHLQKQHPEISQHHIENWIHVNEPSLLEDGEQGFSDGRDSVSPTESYDNTGIVWVDILVISQCTHRHTLLEDGEQGFSDGRDSVSPAGSYDNTGIVWVDILVISQCTHRHTLLDDGEQGFSDGRDYVSPTGSYDNTGIVWVNILVISQCTHRHTGLQ